MWGPGSADCEVAAGGFVWLKNGCQEVVFVEPLIYDYIIKVVFCKFLSLDATKALGHAFVTSKSTKCNVF